MSNQFFFFSYEFNTKRQVAHFRLLKFIFIPTANTTRNSFEDVKVGKLLQKVSPRKRQERTRTRSDFRLSGYPTLTVCHLKVSAASTS